MQKKGIFGRKRQAGEAEKPPSPVKKVVRISKEVCRVTVACYMNSLFYAPTHVFFGHPSVHHDLDMTSGDALSGL